MRKLKSSQKNSNKGVGRGGLGKVESLDDIAKRMVEKIQVHL